MGRLFHTLLAALALACVLAPACLAVPVEDGLPQAGTGIGALSDRYDSLNKLENSLTEEENVVIETRIGVLAAVNQALDMSEVRFSGEVVGDVVNAEAGYKWINAADASDVAISVFMTDDQAKLIKNTGNYHATGTALKMTGIYHMACPVHQGELDVHTTGVEVLDVGGPVTHLLPRGRLSIAIVCCVAAALVLAAFLLTRTHFGNREDT